VFIVTLLVSAMCCRQLPGGLISGGNQDPDFMAYWLVRPSGFPDKVVLGVENSASINYEPVAGSTTI
jgi:hypothetical protein